MHIPLRPWKCLVPQSQRVSKNKPWYRIVHNFKAWIEKEWRELLKKNCLNVLLFWRLLSARRRFYTRFCNDTVAEYVWHVELYDKTSHFPVALIHEPNPLKNFWRDFLFLFKPQRWHFSSPFMAWTILPPNDNDDLFFRHTILVITWIFMAVCFWNIKSHQTESTMHAFRNKNFRKSIWCNLGHRANINRGIGAAVPTF